MNEKQIAQVQEVRAVLLNLDMDRYALMRATSMAMGLLIAQEYPETRNAHVSFFARMMRETAASNSNDHV